MTEAAAVAVPVGDGVGVLLRPQIVAELHAVVAGVVRVRRARGEVTDADVQLVEALRTPAAANALLMSEGGPVRAGTLDGAAAPGASWVSVTLAASALGFSPRHVLRLLDRGELPGAERIGHIWAIPPVAVAVLKARLTTPPEMCE